MKRTILKMNWMYFWLGVLLLAGFLVRVVLTVHVPFSDGPAFRFWALYLQHNSLGSLFKDLPGGYTPYPPLYYYILWFQGLIITQLHVTDRWFVSELILRLPTYMADIGSTLLIFTLVKKLYGAKSAFVSSIFFIFHPALIVTSCFWAQFDGIILFLSLITIKLLIEKKNELAIGIFLLGCLLKLQMLPIAPLVAIFGVKRWRGLLRYIPVYAAIGLIPFLPVVVQQGWRWTFAYFRTLPNWYPYTSVYATNFWGLWGFLVRDSISILGIPLKLLSTVLVVCIATVVALPFFKKQSTRSVYWATLLLFFTFSFWSTRVHSRYFIYSLPFIAIFSAEYPLVAMVFSLLAVGNVLLPAQGMGIDTVVVMLNNHIVVWGMIGIGLLLYGVLVAYYRKLLSKHR